MGTTNNEESTSQTQKLPPGVVLGPDGKPCKVCTAFRHWKPLKNMTTPKAAATTTTTTTKGPVNSQHTIDPISASLAIASAIPPIIDLPRPDNCPPDVEQLGRATWSFLHTTAAYYPERADPTQARHMYSLLSALPTLYPCSHCASHLGECMKRNPPDVSGRAALSRWLCERHNEVNVRLGKPSFDCNKTDERWKDGPLDGSCD
ncbi:hypothetical protein Clacol_005667 [Clathrus columnatus]|uniref:Sulfhydryl oxidase n=1 Tax=Clathrus columnatus TaxID=1419009 RepID=A0AAV5AE20_9AGAM|nr:hypothetical protein Clacol_005667 [Clathrus columnatus]